MKFVVDTNILFSFFKHTSITKGFLLLPKLEFISSEKALEELNKYSVEIIKKSNINKNEFDKILSDLKQIVKFYRKNEYLDFIKQAQNISPDKDDADFLALSLKFSCPLWSNDVLLKTQDKVNVFSTEEMLDLRADY